MISVNNDDNFCEQINNKYLMGSGNDTADEGSEMRRGGMIS